MSAAPAIAVLVVGAALCGGVLELLVPDGNQQTMRFEEVLASVGAWLSSSFLALAQIMKKR